MAHIDLAPAAVRLRSERDREGMKTTKIPTPEVIARLVGGITTTMFGMSFKLETAPDRALPWRTVPPWGAVCVAIAGREPITVALASNPIGAAALAAAMFSCDPKDIDKELLDDALRELGNVVAGGIKTAMGVDQALGIPKTILTASFPELDQREWRSVSMADEKAKAKLWVAVCL
jgi:hypothetical protein